MVEATCPGCGGVMKIDVDLGVPEQAGVQVDRCEGCGRWRWVIRTPVRKVQL